MRPRARRDWHPLMATDRCRARRERLSRFQRPLSEKWPTPRPESGLDCLVCAEFARHRHTPRCSAFALERDDYMLRYFEDLFRNLRPDSGLGLVEFPACSSCSRREMCVFKMWHAVGQAPNTSRRQTRFVQGKLVCYALYIGDYSPG